jgi:hypothetical protein
VKGSVSIILALGVMLLITLWAGNSLLNIGIMSMLNLSYSGDTWFVFFGSLLIDSTLIYFLLAGDTFDDS